MARRRPTGFTLVEISVGLALGATLTALAWPSLREPLLRSRRADAVAALTRIQLAQEQYRGLHGRYADRLDGLRGTTGTRSAEGLYELELHADGAHRYEALARPRAGSAADGDARCPELRLQVDDGRARLAPDNRCWNR